MVDFILPPIESLSTTAEEVQAKVLDTLFEPSQPLHNLTLALLRDRAFSSYPDLISAVGTQLINLSESGCADDTKWLLAILSSHPRLGEKKVDSAQSRAEQANLHRGGKHAEPEKEELARLNREYEEKYPGLRYLVFVNNRSRPEILADMRSRIERDDIKAERVVAIRAMCEIATDRARKLGEY